jgi:oligoendopeptidase F
VAEGKEGARDRYLAMLKGGCSQPPLELLKRAGADLTRPDVIEAAADLLDSTLDEMEALLN